jgi:hypothetical protein
VVAGVRRGERGGAGARPAAPRRAHLAGRRRAVAQPAELAQVAARRRDGDRAMVHRHDGRTGACDRCAVDDRSHVGDPVGLRIGGRGRGREREGQDGGRHDERACPHAGDPLRSACRCQAPGMTDIVQTATEEG